MDSVMNIKALSDQKLFELCQQYGERARLWRQKFAGLLPEVYTRKLYEKKGYGSILEFAAKLAGMSRNQVNLVLNLEKRFENKPILKSLLINDEVTVNKLARIVSIANPENQEFLANQTKLLSNRALETLVKDLRNNKKDNNEDGLFEPLFQGKSLHVQMRSENEITDDGETKTSCEILPSSKILHLKLSGEIIEKLLDLQTKGIDINQLLKEFLEKRELEMKHEKEQIIKAMEREQQQKQPSRYIPVKIRKILKQEFGKKCAVPRCTRTAQVIHHTNRFSLSRNHDPYFLAPLCKEHHLIAHTIDIKFYKKRPCNGWLKRMNAQQRIN